MPKPFFETTRSLEADGYRSAYLTLALVGLLALTWAWWFFDGRVATWETTDKATLEVNGKVSHVDAPTSGRVEKQYLEVGRKVTQGEVLVVLDLAQHALELEEERSRASSFAAQREAAMRMGQANLDALQRGLTESRNQIEKARSELNTAKLNAGARKDVVERYARLAAQKMVSEIEYLDAQAKYDQAYGAQETAALTLTLSQSQLNTATQNLAVKQAEIAERLSELDGSLATSRATLQRLENLLAQRSIRAPVSGTLGEVAQLQAGAYVSEGFSLCAIVPEGTPRVAAQFTPAVALGRIRVGQEARVRLVGFPWTQYGSLKARVTSVGSEPREGMVQVELELVGQTPAEIPIQHGLPGSVEVQIKKISPLTLALRSAGIRLQGGSGTSP